jgi:hypothetical protein
MRNSIENLLLLEVVISKTSQHSQALNNLDQKEMEVPSKSLVIHLVIVRDMKTHSPIMYLFMSVLVTIATK